MSHIQDITDAEFETLIKGDLPVLVDFWAPWCAPCRKMAPILHEIAEEFQGRLTVAKIDIDQHQATAENLGILSIPAFRFFKGGKSVLSLTGSCAKEALVQAAEDVIGEKPEEALAVVEFKSND